MPPRIFILIGLSVGALTACGPSAEPEEEPVLVFAAASLADVMAEAAAAWEAAGGGPVELSFAGSNDLARQVAAGAPADLLVAADGARLEMAAEGGRVDPERSVPLLGNELVVVVPASAEEVPEVASARDLLAFDRLGLADPEAVPAGIYARAWLEAEGVWEELRDRVVPALDVRANLAAVASGGVPAGVVYATDAAAPGAGEPAAEGLAARVRVVFRVPSEGGAAPIVYWAAPVADGGSGRAALFLDFLAGPEAAEIFRRHGFRHLPPERPSEPRAPEPQPSEPGRDG